MTPLLGIEHSCQVSAPIHLQFLFNQVRLPTSFVLISCTNNPAWQLHFYFYRLHFNYEGGVDCVRQFCLSIFKFLEFFLRNERIYIFLMFSYNLCDVVTTLTNKPFEPCVVNLLEFDTTTTHENRTWDVERVPFIIPLSFFVLSSIKAPRNSL